MKMKLIALASLISVNVYAGGSSFNCTSTDGTITFSGYGGDSVDSLSIIRSEAVKNKDGKILGKSVTVQSASNVQGKNLPDFGTPQDSTDTVEAILSDVKAQAKEKADPNNDTLFVLGLGKAKILEAIEESHCRDTGYFIFEQNFAVVTVQYAPYATAVKTHPLIISTKTKKFLCTSGYATTMGGRCQEAVGE